MAARRVVFFSTGFYDAAGNWRQVTEPMRFGRDGFGGWGSYERLRQRLLSRRELAPREAANRIETLNHLPRVAPPALRDVVVRYERRSA